MYHNGNYGVATEHCEIYFVSPISILDGLRADAVFGEELFRGVLELYLRPGAKHIQNMGLVDYICHVEFAHDCYKEHPEWFVDKDYSESKRHLELSTAFADGFEAGMASVKCPIMNVEMNVNKSTISAEKIREVFERAKADGVLKPKKYIYNIDVASLYPHMFEIKTSPLDKVREDIYKRQQAIYDYILTDVKVIKEVSKEMNGIRFNLPEIKNVIFNDPATIVMWADGTKTVVQCQDGDIYDPEKGLAMAISKKIMGNKRDYYHTFKHWLKKYKEPEKV